MNRRHFISTSAAVIGAAGLTPSSAPAISPRMLANARIFATSHNRCTPDLLVRHLRVSPEMAGHIQRQLVRRGIITAPVAGASVAVNPANTYCIPNEALKPNNIAQKICDLRAHARRLLEQLDQDEDQISMPDAV
ncbi:twin-arginine translocation signal domain-containing protein [Sulfitobacter sp. S190]|uniref:twin-arginine translocation signal domain-containing protein n=1 Tax=Sulfitobacter sp. S190 TaxID=2867022 RepID=UPI0021A92CDC|nr:twin-arginine translocation signal domain-containing protein [Sulfitobacter sp. S190]UWR22046.1 twin-arginine translocation signal domain-containing protein [Sulfitobacter sp. S190]